MAYRRTPAQSCSRALCHWQVLMARPQPNLILIRQPIRCCSTRSAAREPLRSRVFHGWTPPRMLGICCDVPGWLHVTRVHTCAVPSLPTRVCIDLLQAEARWLDGALVVSWKLYVGADDAAHLVMRTKCTIKESDYCVRTPCVCNGTKACAALWARLPRLRSCKALPACTLIAWHSTPTSDRTDVNAARSLQRYTEQITGTAACAAIAAAHVWCSANTCTCICHASPQAGMCVPATLRRYLCCQAKTYPLAAQQTG